MAQRKDITSTEKLLQVIRSRKASEPAPAEPLLPAVPGVPAPVPGATFPRAAEPAEETGPPERMTTPVTVVIRDVRPARAESLFAEAAPEPAPSFPYDAETSPAPAAEAGRPFTDAGGREEPAVPPSAGAEALAPADPAEPLFAARVGDLSEPGRPETSLPAQAVPDTSAGAAGSPDPVPAEAESEGAGEALPAEPVPSPGTGLFNKALASLAWARRKRVPAGGAETAPPAAEAAEGTPAGKRARLVLAMPRLGALQKTATVGIDIGHEFLRLVRAVKTAGGRWEVLDRRRFALPPKTGRETPEFASFLKSSLASLCGPAGRTELWVSMSAANVDVRHIRIPKVAKKQIANAVYWTVRKETPFDEKELILDFETQGEVIEQGIPKLAVMVYTAPRREIEDLRGLFEGIGWPLTGISIVPFSVQNLFRTSWITAHDGNIASLFIGNDFSRIDIYAADNLVMTRGIKAGMSSMVEALVESLNEGRGPGQAQVTFEEGRRILRSLSPDSPPLAPGETGYGMDQEEIFRTVLPALERLTRQAERTFEHYAATVPGERIIRIYVSGAMNLYPPVVDYVGSQLGIASAALDPLSEQAIAVCPDVDDRDCLSERIAFGPALGLALSDNHHTPNLMFTYRDREREGSITRINRSVFAVFIALVLVCAGIFAFQNLAMAKKRATLAGIERQIEQLGPPLDQNRLLQSAAKVTQRRQLSRGYAERYLGMVLISELAALTPGNIRFTDLKISLGPVRTGDAPPQPSETAKPRVEEVTVEGLILGDRALFETTLAAYVMTLEASPLFRQVVVQKNGVEPYVKGEVLHFILLLKVEAQVHG